MNAPRQYHNRTAVIYFGPTKQDYLTLVESEHHQAYLEYVQPFLKTQLPLDLHKDGCTDTSRYTIL